MTRDTPTYRTIARLMCHTTQQVLWEHYRPNLHSGSRLVCRPGSGRATYHRFDYRTRDHLITYGVRMVAAKHDPATAAGWLSTREIRSRGYFNGEVSVLNLLAHTCTHEFAHLLQQHDGKRYHGSVHNHHFYRLLDQLNHSGLADRVRQHLDTSARDHGLALDTSPMALPAADAQAQQWQRGQKVCFGEGTSRREGEIVRINRKTCTVAGTGASRGLRFRVPFMMLSLL